LLRDDFRLRYDRGRHLIKRLKLDAIPGIVNMSGRSRDLRPMAMPFVGAACDKRSNKKSGGSLEQVVPDSGRGDGDDWRGGNGVGAIAVSL
jgi:hypothetical protein